MSEWQPIETAPDASEDLGRRVIVYYPRDQKEPVRAQLADGGFWRWGKAQGHYHPTHWMPLPEPPK